MKTAFLLGLDLGQSSDYTALAVLERHGNGREALFHARHIRRYPPGTPYPAVITDVRGKLAQLPASDGLPTLVVDETGVGKPVIDLFKDAGLNARMKPVRIVTGGASADMSTFVSRRELVSAVQVALQTERLKVAASLPEAALLVRELQNFRIKETALDTYGAWRESAHDDLVLSVALALWQGTQASAKLITW